MLERSRASRLRDGQSRWFRSTRASPRDEIVRKEPSRLEGLENPAPPSEVFAAHVWVCMITDRYAMRNRDLIGVDKITWEADFPHNDSNWPNSRKVLADACADVPDEEVRRIGGENARELYRFPRP